MAFPGREGCSGRCFVAIGNARFRLGFRNAGTRTAERVVLNVLWPADVPIDAIAGPAWVQPGSSDATLEDLGRGLESCIYWSAVLGPFDANNSYVATMLETRSGFNGRFPVEVRINYDDLPTPSDDLHRFEVVIPEQGANIECALSTRPLWRDLDPTWDRITDASVSAIRSRIARRAAPSSRPSG